MSQPLERWIMHTFFVCMMTFGTVFGVTVGCKGPVSPIVAGLVACDAVDVTRLVTDGATTILEDVAKILIGSGETWSQALHDLGSKLAKDGKQVGADTVSCAVKDFNDVAATLYTAMNGSAGPATAAKPPSTAMLRARQYLTGVRFK